MSLRFLFLEDGFRATNFGGDSRGLHNDVEKFKELAAEISDDTVEPYIFSGIHGMGLIIRLICPK